MPPQETKQKNPFNLSDEKVERLAAATLNFYHRFLLRKNARDELDAKKAELRSSGIL